MEIIGRIKFAFPEINGVSNSSGKPWKKREYVLETFESFPKLVHFDFFGDRADQYPLQVGQDIKLTFSIESREYNGRWYTSIRGLKAEAPGAPQAADPYAPPTGYAQPGAPAAPAYGAPAAPAYGAPAAYPQPAAPAAPAYGAPAAYPQGGAQVPPPPQMPQDPTEDIPF